MRKKNWELYNVHPNYSILRFYPRSVELNENESVYRFLKTLEYVDEHLPSACLSEDEKYLVCITKSGRAFYLRKPF